MIYVTPTYFESLTSEKSLAESLLSTIKIVCLAGERFYLNDFIMAKKENYNVIFENQYGPVELHVIATTKTLIENDFDSIGKPIGNNQAYIVDQYLNLVPIGVVGELCIAGDGVGNGYLNRPELTAEKFIPNPFGVGKLYKTGDLAYWREDGDIIYVGRNDFQVKIRGLRIELEEIESVINSVEGISQSVVVVRNDDANRQLICAFYTEAVPVELEAIKASVRDRLPHYMMPHFFKKLDRLPLTTSGKINRKALPDIDYTTIGADVEYVAPVTMKENMLSSAVSDVLRLKMPGMMDNFFALGGDSLKAIELTAALERQGYHVDIKTVFAANTLGQLAAQLKSVETYTEIKSASRDIPATDAQMRVYTAHSISGGTVYNVPYAFKVKNLNPEKLRIAVEKLIARHEILRTRFENRDGIIMQVVDNTAVCKVEALTNDDINEFVRPFDLTSAPLIRLAYHEETVMLDMHHIVTDGGSLPIFLRELNEFYMGRDLTDIPVQYSAFSARKIDYISAETYWLSIFSNELPSLELNTDYPRGNKQTFSGAVIYEMISADLHAKIRMKCQQFGVTPYAFYMGAFHILISKFGGGEDIIVGTPASGRNGKFLNTLGMFVNTLALRSHPIGEKQISAFLREIKETTVDALYNQRYPYGELIKKLDLQTTNRNPLFDFVFAYQSAEMTEIIFGDKPAELLPVPITTSKYDFTFTVIPRNHDAVLMVEYCTDLYKKRTMMRLIEGYKLLLAQMLDGNKHIADITAMTEQELHTLLFDFNDTAVDYPRRKCVHQLFEEQVQKVPDKTAVIACDRTLTYGELNKESNRIAHGLIRQGVKLGDTVAFALPRDSHLLPTIFGILKSGAAYLPIDPDYPQNRIDYMLKDTGTQYFLTQKDVAELLKTDCTANPGIYPSGDEKFCIIYTSGSTGNPKGCILIHRGVCNFCVNNNVIQYFNQIGLSPIGISLNNVTFDYFIAENIVLLTHGAVTVLCNEDQSILPAQFWGLCSAHKVNLIQTTPTKYRIMLESPECSYLENMALLVTSGEPLTGELLMRLRSYTSAKVFNPLGPSETTVWSPNGEGIEEANIHIGRPFANTQVYILDKHLKPVPIGVTGELCIAGDGVGAGYLNRSELTAKKFLPNPFGAGHLYMTGDLAYWREDGNIGYVGRNDFQVKIRGLRIELGEIENTIARVDGVNQSVVVVRQDDAGRQLICAFYTEIVPVKPETIKTALREKLPRYMIPHVFIKLDKLPITTSGKVNRKALPDIDLTAIQSTADFVAPEGQREKTLAALMEQVLGFAPVGREDDFFDLGGDSLKAIEFVSKAHTEGIYFSLQNVFDHPNVRALCNCIDNGDRFDISYEDIDFAEINRLLSRNSLNDIFIPPETDIGDILLTGATGFLGHLSMIFCAKWQNFRARKTPTPMLV